jgi:hypothetical protein
MRPLYTELWIRSMLQKHHHNLIIILEPLCSPNLAPVRTLAKQGVQCLAVDAYALLIRHSEVTIEENANYSGEFGFAGTY